MADQDDPGESIDPFANMPLFGDLSRALSGQGPLNWDAARQFAVLAANGGGLLSGTGVSTSANVDPTVRIKYRELADIARLHVGDVMQLEVPATEPDVATPSNGRSRPSRRTDRSSPIWPPRSAAPTTSPPRWPPTPWHR